MGDNKSQLEVFKLIKEYSLHERNPNESDEKYINRLKRMLMDLGETTDKMAKELQVFRQNQSQFNQETGNSYKTDYELTKTELIEVRSKLREYQEEYGYTINEGHRTRKRLIENLAENANNLISVLTGVLAIASIVFWLFSPLLITSYPVLTPVVLIATPLLSCLFYLLSRNNVLEDIIRCINK